MTLKYVLNYDVIDLDTLNTKKDTTQLESKKYKWKTGKRLNWLYLNFENVLIKP